MAVSSERHIYTHKYKHRYFLKLFYCNLHPVNNRNGVYGAQFIVTHVVP